MKTINRTLKPGRDSLASRFHPWVFSGAIIEENDPDDTPHCKLIDTKGNFIAWAQFNKGSKIRARILSLDANELPDLEFYEKKLAQSFTKRKNILNQDTNAARLCFADADGLPGLIIDYFNGVMVIQSLSQGSDLIKAELIAPLQKAFALVFPKHSLLAIYEKSTGDGRKLENLAPVEGVLWGRIPENLEIKENGISFLLEISSQKTGFYCDQRANRQKISGYVQGKDILDVCSFTGGFSVYAAHYGARSVSLVDNSQDALDLAQDNLEKFNISKHFIQGDAFDILRKLVSEEKRYDLIVLDPPKLAPNRKSLEKGLQAYKDLNMWAMKLLRPDGILFTFSCSGIVSSEDLRLWIAFAAKDIGARLEIIEQLHQAPCHPIPLGYPEAEYLKGFILRKIN